MHRPGDAWRRPYSFCYITGMSTSQSRFSTGYAIVAALFFLSGLTSLIYQVIWTRYLVFVFGSTTFATATVLSVFMGGLALGSFVAGRFADRAARPFLTYGILEAIIGVWALLVPFFFELAVPLYQAAWQSLHLSLLPFSLVRFAVAAVILLVPTTCMGATLPILSRFVTQSLTVVGERVGSLYAANTLGAVLGSMAAGFYLLPSFGIQATTFTAAAGNGLLFLAVVATAAWLEKGTSLGDSQSHTQAAPGTEATAGTTTDSTAAAAASTSPMALKLAIAGFAVSGGLSMIYEVAWTRTLLMVIGSTTYAFTIMLASFLVGIFVGSLIAARLVDKAKSPLAWFAALQFMICLAALISVTLFNFVPYWNLTATAAMARDPSASMFLRFLLSSLVLMPITLFVGATFPVIIKATAKDLSQIGRSVGSVYAANTLGAIIGSFLAGFVIIPITGAERALILASLGNLFLGGVLLFSLSEIKRAVRIAALAACVVVAGIKSCQPDSWNHLLLLSAQLERRSILFAPSLVRDRASFDSWRKAVDATTQLLFWHDGPCANVGVVRWRTTGLTSLLTNGHVDASDGPDMPNQILVSTLPLLVNSEAKNAAIVGWGSGVTVGAAALFPLDSIKAIELEPSVLDAARHFDRVNWCPQNEPRVHPEINDGRNYLLATGENFDVIISEPSNPWQAGVCNLFTREYFAICKQRLKENGVLACWLQLNEIAPKNVQSVLSALHEVFPYTMPIQSHEGDTIVLASNQPLHIDYAHAASVIADKRYHEAFARSHIDSADVLISRILATPEAVAAFTKDTAPNTDDRNRLEYEVGRTYEDRFFTINNLTFFGEHGGDPTSVVTWEHINPEQKKLALVGAASAALTEGKPLVCIKWATAANKLEPQSRAWQLIGEAHYARQDQAEAAKAFAQALTIDPQHIPSLLSMAKQRRTAGDVLEARKLAESAYKIDNKNEQARLRLAQTYMPSVRGVLTHKPLVDVPDTADKALELLAPFRNPDQVSNESTEALRLLAMAEFQKKHLREATGFMSNYLEREPSNINAWLDLARIESESGHHQNADSARARAEKVRHTLVTELLRESKEYLKRGRVTKASELINQAHAVDPANEAVNAAVADLAAADKHSADSKQP